MTAAVRVGDPDPTPELDKIVDYCWAPHRTPGLERTRYCSWPWAHDGDHVSADAGEGGGVVAVWSDSTAPLGRYWSPRDSRPYVFGPTACGLAADAWTDAMAAAGRDLHINRQCSIGWHGECSDPGGDECRCACHGEIPQ